MKRPFIYKNQVIWFCSILASFALMVHPIPDRESVKLTVCYPPLIAFHVHTSTSTFDRVKNWHYFENHMLVQSGRYKIKYVLSDRSPLTTHNDTVLRVDCEDVTPGLNGLVCRVEKSYSQMLMENPHCRWFYRAMDDTYIRIEKFHKWLNYLDRVYDPLKHILFRSVINIAPDGCGYLHGGTGWLMSRAFLEFHVRRTSLAAIFRESLRQQDDTAESMIIYKMYGNNHWIWNSLNFMGCRCTNCDLLSDPIDLRKFPRCNTRELSKLRDVVVFHTIGWNSEWAGKVIDAFDKAPPQLKLWKTWERNHLCVSDDSGDDFTEEKRVVHYMTDVDFPDMATIGPVRPLPSYIA